MHCEEFDYEMCCATPVKHTTEPAKVLTELPTDMPAELLTDMTAELANRQADKKHTAILQDWQCAATINISDMQKDKPDKDITTATSAHPGVQDQGCSMQDSESARVHNPSSGLKHISMRVQRARQTATTDKPAVDLMPFNLPTVKPYFLQSPQAQQDAEAVLQNQRARALKELQKIKFQQAWLQHCLQHQEASLKVSRASATTTESACACTATAPQQPQHEAQDRTSR